MKTCKTMMQRRLYSKRYIHDMYVHIDSSMHYVMDELLTVYYNYMHRLDMY